MTDVARGERTSFVHLVEQPGQGRAWVHYCLPLPDGTAQQPNRRFVTYPIVAPPWTPGERPFWVDLATRPLDPSIAGNPFAHLEIDAFYGSREPRDRVIFMLDRDVVVGRPNPSTTAWGRDLDGNPYPVGPEVSYRRIQHRAQIPQRPGSTLEFLQPQQVLVRRLGRGVEPPPLVRAANSSRPPFTRQAPQPHLGRDPNRRVLRGDLDMVVLESPRDDGGVRVQFVLQWKWSRHSSIPADFESPVVAEVDLAVQDPRQPAAWFYDVGPRRGSAPLRARFDYAATNVQATARVRLGLLDSMLRGWNPESAARWQFLRTTGVHTPFLELRFGRDGQRVVPRPTSGQSIRTTSLTSEQNHYAGVRIEPLGDETLSQVATDLMIGLIPIVGDVVDIGEFVLALGTGRDRWGRQVSSQELFLLGLGAVMPLMSSRGLRLVGDARAIANRGAQQVRTLWGSSEAFLRHIRPAFLARLQEAGSLRRLAEMAARRATTSASAAEVRFMNRLADSATMGEVRDLQLARRMQGE